MHAVIFSSTRFVNTCTVIIRKQNNLHCSTVEQTKLQAAFHRFKLKQITFVNDKLVQQFL